jgi:hypothetical protein
MSVRRMTRIGRTLTTAVMLLTFAVAPTAAGANPLLSGYGGPGQGDQAILGSGLVNPPGGGSAGRSGTVSSSELTVTPSHTAGPAASSGGSKHDRRKAGGSGKQGTAKKSPAAPASVAPATGLQPVSSTSSGGTLGLSGGDLLLIVLGLAALALTALLTRQLTRRTP